MSSENRSPWVSYLREDCSFLSFFYFIYIYIYIYWLSRKADMLVYDKHESHPEISVK